MSDSDSITVTQPQILAWARRLAFESPQLADLTPAQLEQVAQFVIFSSLRDNLKRLADLSRIDAEVELKTFLCSASPTNSWQTLETYAWGIARLELWLEKTGIDLLSLLPSQADDYIYWLRAQGRAPATIRIEVAAASSFFSFLERRFDVIKNPFRGSRARPAVLPRRPLVVPTPEELVLMLDAARPFLRAALVFMSTRGFRVGALPTLVLERDRFSGRSKGKSIHGILPAEALTSLEGAGLHRRLPFLPWTGVTLSHRVISLTRPLAARGLLRAAFSAHDLRHYFAITQYKSNPDLYRLKGLLGHSGIGTTERYLRSLGTLV